MPLPETIQIGPYTYTLMTDEAERNKITIADGVTFWGKIEHDKLRILVDDTAHLARQRAVILHEVLHGCWEVSDPEGSTFTEEQAVRNITGTLLDTLRRNPDLVAFLLEAE